MRNTDLDKALAHALVSEAVVKPDSGGARIEIDLPGTGSLNRRFSRLHELPPETGALPIRANGHLPDLHDPASAGDDDEAGQKLTLSNQAKVTAGGFILHTLRKLQADWFSQNLVPQVDFLLIKP